jgi:hypothetical protein
MTRDAARAVSPKAKGLASAYSGRAGTHPPKSMTLLNSRPALRRWVAVNMAMGAARHGKESFG